MNKNISIITNFGCRANCWYCIWKQHPLQHINEPTNWHKLESFLQKYRFLGKVSVSGGGDCLYHYDENEDWWHKLFMLIYKYRLKLDIHTREKYIYPSFWHKINRCVFSSDVLDQDKNYLKNLVRFTQLRITHLVTQHTTFDLIDQYLAFADTINCQFTIKQLIGYDDAGMYNKIKTKYPNIFYLDSGDYNIYYMPNNTIQEKFLNTIKKIKKQGENYENQNQFC